MAGNITNEQCYNILNITVTQLRQQQRNPEIKFLKKRSRVCVCVCVCVCVYIYEEVFIT